MGSVIVSWVGTVANRVVEIGVVACRVGFVVTAIEVAATGAVEEADKAIGGGTDLCRDGTVAESW